MTTFWDLSGLPLLFVAPLAVVAARSIGFGEDQMSTLDRRLGARSSAVRDHHGIDGSGSCEGGWS